MAEYVKDSAGPPVGAYSRGDTVTDSEGVVWECVVSGNPAQFDVQAAGGAGYDPLVTWQFIEDFDHFASADGIDYVAASGNAGPWELLVTGTDAGQISFSPSGGGVVQILADNDGETEISAQGMCARGTYDYTISFSLSKPSSVDADPTEFQFGLFGNNGSRNSYVSRTGDEGIWSLVINGTPLETTYTEPGWEDLTTEYRLYRLVTTALGDTDFQTSDDGETWTSRISSVGDSFHGSVSNLKARSVGSGATTASSLLDTVVVTSVLDR